jgi:LPXTG-site transpeptidase (sortase) family protein
MAAKILQALRIIIPCLLLWGILGVYVPVVVEELRYQARKTAYNFEAVFPQGLRGFFIPSWTITTPPVWAEGYGLEIPKLGIRQPVVEGVDAADKSSYSMALKNGVAHAAGTAVPGEAGVGYYFAHSSGWPFAGSRAAVFSTLYKLEPGDEVVLHRMGKKYVYIVVEKAVVGPRDVSLLAVTGGVERVVLQTCWPLGTSLKRLLVSAEAEGTLKAMKSEAVNVEGEQ